MIAAAGYAAYSRASASLPRISRPPGPHPLHEFGRSQRTLAVGLAAQGERWRAQRAGSTAEAHTHPGLIPHDLPWADIVLSGAVTMGQLQSGSSLRAALTRELTGKSVIAPGYGLSSALASATGAFAANHESK